VKKFNESIEFLCNTKTVYTISKYVTTNSRLKMCLMKVTNQNVPWAMSDELLLFSKTLQTPIMTVKCAASPK